jgi:uncharacterized membrane protein
MKHYAVGLIVFAILAIAAALHAAQHYRELPDRVASRFDLTGNAVGSTAKSSLVALNGAAIAAVVFAIGMSVRAARRSPESLQIASKDYWLAPERRDATLHAFVCHMLWLLNAAMLLIVVLFGAMYHANLRNPPTMERAPLAAIALFLAFIVGWTVSLKRRFARRPQATKDPDANTT